MISVRFFSNSHGLCGFDISGHAGRGTEGHDIPCACVSSAVQMAANTITECMNVAADIGVKENFITLRLKDDSDSATKVIEGLKLQLTLLSQEYKGTIKITVTEV